MSNKRPVLTNRFALASEQAGLTLTVVNKQLNKPTLYIDETAQLDFALWNNSQTDLILQSGDEPSTLSTFLPRTFFTTAQRGDMKISLADWAFVNSPADGALTLTYTGADGTPWKAGTRINFSVTNVLSTASPDAKNLNVNFDNIYDTPPFLQASLALITKPAGKPKLADTLQISLDNQGVIFVSSRNGELVDALPNTLVLNIKNSGSKPLYQSEATWKGDPKVAVTFVYGSTSGALAPDDDKDNPELGSAWNILASLPVAQVQWGFTQPNRKGDASDPEWTLYPVPSNKQILGLGDQANVTFAFAPIVSFTSTGHTQMTLVFSGFRQDENTEYEPAVFVLDINKQDPPPTRGLLNFSSIDPLVVIDKPKEATDLLLSWGMFDVASIQLLCSYPGAAPYIKKYPIDAVPSTYPLGYDNYKFSIPAISNSTPIFFTLQSYDGLGGFLNSLQFTIFLDLAFFVDPRDGTVYPVIQVGRQLWLAANLKYKSGIFYNENPKYDDPYGRLYTAAQLDPQPEGWRVPTNNDWLSLFLAQKVMDDHELYKALIAGGTSGFNARLGGYYDPGPPVQVFQGLGVRGYYWSSTPKNKNEMYCVKFSTESGQGRVTIPPAVSLDNSFAASIRLVKDI